MSEETMDMRGEDRLPWLEAVEEDEADGLGIGKLLLFILGGLAIVVAIVGAAFWLNSSGGETEDGTQIIAAPEQDYRVRPSEAGGMEVEGEGDTAFAASEGENPDARIDPSAVPEQPVTGRRVASTAGENSGNEVNRNPSGSSSARIRESGSQPASTAARTASASSQPSASSGRLVQLGAFSSEEAANRAWQVLSGRYDYLSGLDTAVTPVETGGHTLYRLRAVTDSPADARRICGRLRVATEACSVVGG